MSNLNRCQFIGNLGMNPEMRFTASGDPITSFSLACNRHFSNSAGERLEETEWINVITWNKQAESCNRFLAKGDLVYVEGRLHTQSWESHDGQKHSRTEVVASNVIFLNKKSNTEHPEALVPDDIPIY